MEFTKMQGLGNDYVYVNCFSQRIDNPAAMAVRVSDRHFGIGSDGLILICPSDIADVRMRMFNADGSEAQMCGNGIRCVAKYVYDHGLARTHTEFSIPGLGTFPTSLRIETRRGILTLGLELDEHDKVRQVCVNMGQPILDIDRIPVTLPRPIDSDRLVDFPLNKYIPIGNPASWMEDCGLDLHMTCVSMGNPHLVIFCAFVDAVPLETIGPFLENQSIFPERINVHFVQVDSPDEFTMRTWERGSGITLACGTGACACAVAGVLGGRCQRRVTAHLPGGDLQLYWCEQDNCVYMTGPAVEVFSGVWPE